MLSRRGQGGSGSRFEGWIKPDRLLLQLRPEGPEPCRHHRLKASSKLAADLCGSKRAVLHPEYKQHSVVHEENTQRPELVLPGPVQASADLADTSPPEIHNQLTDSANAGYSTEGGWYLSAGYPSAHPSSAYSPVGMPRSLQKSGSTSICIVALTSWRPIPSDVAFSHMFCRQ